MEFNDPISYSLDVQMLGTNGYEVIISIVNEGEDFLLVKEAFVEVIKDEDSIGKFKVSFFGASPLGTMTLGQFEIAKGHFHIGKDLDHDLINFKVDISYRYDGHDSTRKISKRIETQRITKKRKWWGGK